MKKLIVLPLLLAALFACNPKTQVGQSFVGKTNKIARYTITPGASTGSGDNAKQFYNYYVEVCDFEGKTAINCKSTLVLENIDMGMGF
jgi:hypothetical protein